MCTYIGIALHNAWVYHELKENRCAQEELHLVREQLVQVEKQSGPSDLVVGIVHEIRTRLRTAQGQCALFGNDDVLTPSMASHLEKIDACIGKAATIAQNFLDVARQNTMQETTDVNSVINQTVDRMAYEFRSSAVNIVLNLETLPLISAHPDDVQQVLLNFLKNALDAASKRGTTATVSVRSAHHRHNHSVCIEVSDKGRGVPRTFSIELPVQRSPRRIPVRG